MTPDSANHATSPEYIRSLIMRTGLTKRECARRLGITDRALRYYCAPIGAKRWDACPYLVQFGLECLACE